MEIEGSIRQLAELAEAAGEGQALDRMLAQDSQRGTNISQESAQQSTSLLTQDHLTELHRLLTHYAPTIPAEFIVPGTFRRAGVMG